MFTQRLEFDSTTVRGAHRPQHRRAARFAPKRLAGRIGAGLASTAVVSLGALYIAAPSSSALTIKARQGGFAPPGTVVVYGTVTNSAKQPIAAAQVTVTSDRHPGFGNGRSGGVVGEVRTDPKGSYRLQLFIPPGEYTVDMSVANGTLHRDFQINVPGSGGWGTTTAFHGNGQGQGEDQGNARFSGHTAFMPRHRIYSVGNHGIFTTVGNDGDGGWGGGWGFTTGSSGFPPGNHFGLVTGSEVLAFAPGISYQVSAQLTSSNVLSFLPVGSY